MLGCEYHDVELDAFTGAKKEGSYVGRRCAERSGLGRGANLGWECGEAIEPQGIMR